MQRNTLIHADRQVQVGASPKNFMNEKNYAPIIIPTLCRYEHFKNCIESLSRCTFAEKTDLYIALDYPSSKNHYDGYTKIINYLNKINGFKSVNIVKRKVNYGTLKNSMEAIKIIIEQYDRFIYTEDDTIFSPNFLDYINKGLYKYKTDQSVFAVCGYSYSVDILHGDNNYYRQNVGFPVYGFGIWKHNYSEFQKKFTRTYCIRKLINPVSLYRAARHSSSTLLFLILGALKEGLANDSTYSIFMFFEKKDVILPVLSKVKNMGWDGTGSNCRIDEKQLKKTIDTNDSFEYQGNGYEYYSQNNLKFLKSMRDYMSYRVMTGHLFRMIANRLRRLRK